MDTTHRGNQEILHPAKFPEPLIADFINFFTKRGETVLDPMAGTGSTLVACDKMHRKGIGIELNEKWHHIAKNRTGQTIVLGDARDLKDHLHQLGVNQIDFCITSPPYWDMLHKSRGNIKTAAQIRKEQKLDEVYGDNQNDLGNIENYDQYLNVLRDIYLAVYDVLRDKRYLVVIVQNILTEDGDMVPLAWDLTNKLRSHYVLKQEKLWLQDNKMLGIWGYPNRYVSSVHHHYCLIFEKDTSFRKT